jgi:hypothetical protein
MPCKHMGEWKYSSTFLDLGTRWRWVVSYTPLPLYPRYPLDRRLDGPQSPSGCCGERKILHCWESNQGRPARRLSLYWLSYSNSQPWEEGIKNKILKICRQWTEIIFCNLSSVQCSAESYIQVRVAGFNWFQQYRRILLSNRYCMLSDVSLAVVNIMILWRARRGVDVAW